MTLALILGLWLAVLVVLLVAHHRLTRVVARKELLARVVAALPAKSTAAASTETETELVAPVDALATPDKEPDRAD